MKFGRDYLLTVETGPYGAPAQPVAGGPYIAEAQREVTIGPPYEIEFEIDRAFAATSQTASIRVKNLSKDIRNAIYKDHFASGFYARVKLQAGYKNQYLPTIFDGTITEASSRREGRRDIITDIEALDGGFAIGNSYSSIVTAPGTLVADAIRKLNGDLFGVAKTPVIGSLTGVASIRAGVFIGPTFSIIQRLLPPNGAATIDNNQLKVLLDSDALQFGDQIFVVSSATGLLDPPVRADFGIAVRMLFEPRLTVGQQVELRSIDNDKFNGVYQVKGVSHQAIVSETRGGPAVTSLELYNAGIINALTAAAQL